jgi:hypothetical protein
MRFSHNARGRILATQIAALAERIAVKIIDAG